MRETPTPLKRRRSAVDLYVDNYCPPTKKAKPASVGHGRRPPGYWDTLTKVWLTHGSLAELDRRQDEERRVALSASLKYSPLTAEVDQEQLKKFARHGGPDLTTLRGYSNQITSPTHAMSRSSRSSRSRHQSSIGGSSGNTARSSPYSADFEQKLTDHGIHITSGNKPHNLAEIRQALKQPRPSLSPSQFSESDFERFVEQNDRAIKESRIMSDVLPTIAGTGDRHHFSMDNVQLQNLEPFANGQVTAPTPDRYYGARTSDIDSRVREALGHHIIPSTDQRLPAAPNFFVEAKSISGRADVARRQICLDGTGGERGMRSLQSYNISRPIYDEHAHTITTILHDGQLKLYAHHATQPRPQSDQPEYHMTPLNSFAMTGNADAYRAGAAAFRNARSWTQQQRDGLIADANNRARHEQSDSMSFTSIDHSHDTSATAARFVESDTSADELALDHSNATRRRRKVPPTDKPNRHDVSVLPPPLPPLPPQRQQLAKLPIEKVPSHPSVRGGRRGLQIEHDGRTKFVPMGLWTNTRKSETGLLYCAKLDVYTIVS